MGMKYEWDEPKRQSNFATRGLDFGNASGFDWETALTLEDDRQDYGETRYIAYGLLENRLTVLVYTFREMTVRIISWRKANVREKKHYDEQIQN